MDTFYARRPRPSTVPLDTLLCGNLHGRLTLDDATERTRASETAIDLVVAPPAPERPRRGRARPDRVTQGADAESLSLRYGRSYLSWVHAGDSTAASPRSEDQDAGQEHHGTRAESAPLRRLESHHVPCGVSRSGSDRGGRRPGAPMHPAPSLFAGCGRSRRRGGARGSRR